VSPWCAYCQYQHVRVISGHSTYVDMEEGRYPKAFVPLSIRPTVRMKGEALNCRHLQDIGYDVEVTETHAFRQPRSARTIHQKRNVPARLDLSRRIVASVAGAPDGSVVPYLPTAVQRITEQ
jgi:hypothetical protein